MSCKYIWLSFIIWYDRSLKYILILEQRLSIDELWILQGYLALFLVSIEGYSFLLRIIEKKLIFLLSHRPKSHLVYCFIRYYAFPFGYSVCQVPLCGLILSVLPKHGEDVLPDSKNKLAFVEFYQLKKIGDLGASDWIVHEYFHTLWRVFELKAKTVFELIFDTIELILINLLLRNKEIS